MAAHAALLSGKCYGTYAYTFVIEVHTNASIASATGTRAPGKTTTYLEHVRTRIYSCARGVATWDHLQCDFFFRVHLWNGRYRLVLLRITQLC